MYRFVDGIWGRRGGALRALTQADGAGLARNASSGRGDRAGREERLQFRGRHGDSVSF